MMYGRKEYEGFDKKAWRRNKVLESLREAIERVGLSDGDTISFHHHLRNGDAVVNMVLDAAAKMGIRDLRLAQTALFPVHEPVIEHIKSGVVTAIEGSINGPVGAFISKNAPLKEPVVLRSHGGRVRAVTEGELEIDVAFIAASQADDYGNCNGINGPSAFGPISYSIVDSLYADRVVVVTDELVPYPATPILISQEYVDYVVKVPSIGRPEGIVHGTTRITKDEVKLKIAKKAIEFIDAIGIIKDGFSFQAGAGGISLAAMMFMKEIMKNRGIKASFAMGGTTKYTVEMLREGLVKKLLTGQCFDLEAVESLRGDKNHEIISMGFYANLASGGRATERLSVGFLGATEVDVNFNVNVNTHSDGLLLHGIGGHQDVASGAEVSVIVTPLVRKKIPIVREEVTTISTPGDVVDVVVTDHGVAVNPRRDDIIKKAEESKYPIMSIEELAKTAEKLCGKPEKPSLSDEDVAIIEFVDGTLLDTVKRVA